MPTLNCPHCLKPVMLGLVAVDGNPTNRQPKLPGTKSVGELLEMIDIDTLDVKTAKFVGDTRERYAKYKERIMISDKQIAWLESIAAGKSGNKDPWDE